ncbi:MAG: ATP-binding protein [Acidobacteriaceae bacterium]
MAFFGIYGKRKIILLQVALSMALIALVDWKVEENVPLGFLYLLPMAIAGSTFNRKRIVLLAGLCTFLAEAFDSFLWSPQLGIPRDVLYFSAFSGIGLFVHQVVLSRQEAASQIQIVQNEIRARRDAEEQLKFLIENSPISIFTVDAEGIVLLANDAAHRLFAVPAGTLPAKPVSSFLPSLANVPTLGDGQHSFRTAMQCKGHRQDGDTFIADVWFSTYQTSVGPRLAAMVVDTSEDLRDREESGLHQLLASSRILVGAVSHEIRNVCGAIAVVHENLSRDGVLSQSKDFQALGTLVLALEQIASMKLRETTDQAASVDLESVLEELRIVIGPSLREQEIDVRWEVQPGLPRVWADRQSLMQVFLNLVKNSERAMSDTSPRTLSIQTATDRQRVRVFVKDTGCGVNAPALLFRPFQPQARATGLGLYLSRALMRSFKGDLRYEPKSEGSCFVVELTPILDLLDDPSTKR